MITLNDFSLPSLMKNRISQTEEDAIFFESIEKILKHVHSMANVVSKNYESSEILLDVIAIEENVDLYDSTLSFEQKKNLINRSEFLKRRKGTRAALENALMAIYSDVEIYEWWEYGGDPFHFKIEIPMPEHQSEETNEFLLRVIETYKRTTAILDGINFYTKVSGTGYNAAVEYGLEKVEIYPKEV